jgi:hypothetical protein
VRGSFNWSHTSWVYAPYCRPIGRCNCSYHISDLYYTYTTGTQTWYLGISLQPQRDFVACTLYMTLVVRLSTVTPTSHEQDTCSTGCAWSDTAIRDVPAWTLTLRLPRLSFLVSLRFRLLSHVSTWVRRCEILQQALLGVLYLHCHCGSAVGCRPKVCRVLKR